MYLLALKPQATYKVKTMKIIHLLAVSALLLCAFAAQGQEKDAMTDNMADEKPADAAMMSVDGKININTADAQTLADVMHRVGEKYAAAIVAYREEHGYFETIEDIVKVKGIGPKTLERNRDLITAEMPMMEQDGGETPTETGGY